MRQIDFALEEIAIPLFQGTVVFSQFMGRAWMIISKALRNSTALTIKTLFSTSTN
jgi:hypothetical protein